ncbi:fibronectin type III domain-containing protein [Nannocystis sp. ILAH1]|uniref:fibronectin type III domain-containing protein n=1 Tax=unclassified Nannocystis TaxID=2627009 RepID=UPI002270F5D7|nr:MULTISPECIES: fibronectin type III domain-containing protein [unclassified Nannocystis]MCY0986969.1 fibronectin type III domain-containing protein [Nannocystis sp. ILAH1]MCY1071852.1 fibronectin type III domain-containing protein [Nannocystis sp. RBIL2]
MRHRHAAPLALTLTVLLAACGQDHKSTDATTHAGTHGGADTADTTTSSTGESSSPTTTAAEPPAAPTDLAGSILDGGVHLTWKDASDNEDDFVIENKADGDAEFSVVIELPFDSVTFHDTDVASGKSYVYRVKAVNASGEAVSDEITVQIP